MSEALTIDDMKAEIHAWAETHGMHADFNGEIGLGRPCVGITDGYRYVEVGDFRHETPQEVEDAYYKADYLAVSGTEEASVYLAVLGTGEDAIRQLHVWVRYLDEQGAAVGRQPYSHPIDAYLHPFDQEPVLVKGEGS